MNDDLSLDDFLRKYRIDGEAWEKAGITWECLQAIAHDHDAASADLENSAEFFAKVIQKFKGVHSVRWRVKTSEHLLEKIVRKKSAGNPKYSNIGIDNYFEVVTDLVGVRALHLFKDDCFQIDSSIKETWIPVETPVAYMRDGDSDTLKERFKSEGFDVQDHPAGYRSVHYVIQSTPLKRPMLAEIQVRTIFEEGWSEIDHRLRYPNFSDDGLVEYFLEIFNRMAGSADDMGGFVLGLAATVSQLKNQLLVIQNEKETNLREKEHALSQLESAQKKDRASNERIAMLKAEIENLKKENNPLGWTPALSNLGLLNPSASDMAKYGTAGLMGLERDYAVPINSSTLDQVRRGTLGLTGLERAHRGLIGSQAEEQAKLGMVQIGGLAQAHRGLINSQMEEQAKPGKAGIGGLAQAHQGLISSQMEEQAKGSKKGLRGLLDIESPDQPADFTKKK